MSEAPRPLASSWLTLESQMHSRLQAIRHRLNQSERSISVVKRVYINPHELMAVVNRLKLVLTLVPVSTDLENCVLSSW